MLAICARRVTINFGQLGLLPGPEQAGVGDDDVLNRLVTVRSGRLTTRGVLPTLLSSFVSARRLAGSATVTPK